MGRTARKRSKTGIYHVMLRGIDKRDIFLNNADRRKFTEKLIQAKSEGRFQLFAFCLMSNHVHLLLQEGEEIGKSIKRIAAGYALWHNAQHERTGHLFQNRFSSETVENDVYLLTAARYIHQNPVKANMVSNPLNYLWSSYSHYVSSYQGKKTYVDTDFIRSYLPSQKVFEEFMNHPNEDTFIDYEDNLKITDTKLIAFLKSENYTNQDFLENPESMKLIKEIYFRTGASIRQLERVMNLSKAYIERSLKQ